MTEQTRMESIWTATFLTSWKWWGNRVNQRHSMWWSGCSTSSLYCQPTCMAVRWWLTTPTTTTRTVSVAIQVVITSQFFNVSSVVMGGNLAAILLHDCIRTCTAGDMWKNRIWQEAKYWMLKLDGDWRNYWQRSQNTNDFKVCRLLWDLESHTNDRI